MRDFNRIATGYTYNSDIVWNIREFIIDTLQDRSMSIELKLLKVVNCINRMQVSSDNYLKVIEIYKGITLDEMRELFDKVNVDANKQLDIFKDIVNLRLDMGISNKRYIDLVKDVFKSIGYIENYDEKVYDNYKILKKHYDEKYRNYEYLFENILV